MKAVQARLEAWRKSLLDLSQRNKLLYFGTGRATRVQIVKPELMQLFQALASGQKSLVFPYLRGAKVTDVEMGDTVAQFELQGERAKEQHEARIVPGDLEPSPAVTSVEGLRRLYTQLDRLRKGTKTLNEEQGVHTLYLAFGLLEWHETDHAQDIVRSPLALVPVELRKEEHQYKLVPHDDDIEDNNALIYLLDHMFKLPLPTVSEYDHENGGLNFGAYLDAVVERVRRHGWRITREAWLAQFASYKLPMYRDLGDPATVQLAATHPVVSVFCGVTEPPRPEPIDAGEADRYFSSPEGFTVLPADASQLEVLESVRRGHSLVVHGPPGTGKSQTIVNIIADALRRGQRVLFVSEKRAALEVVHRRLKLLGLDRLCLDLHSHRANRKAVVEDMMAAVRGAHNELPAPYTDDFCVHRRAKERLDQYVRELHERRGKLKRTAHQAHGRLAVLAQAPVVHARLPIASALEMTGDQDHTLREAVAELTATGLWDQAETHIFRDAAPTHSQVWLTDEVRHAADKLGDAVRELSETVARFGETLGLPVPTTIAAGARMREAIAYLRARPLGRMPDVWFSGTPEAQSEALSLIKSAAKQQQAITESRVLLAQLDAAVLADRLPAVKLLLGRLPEAEKARLIPRWRFILEARGVLGRIGARRLRLRRVLPTLRALSEIDAGLRWFAEHGTTLGEGLGFLYRELETDFAAVGDGFAWVKGLPAHLDMPLSSTLVGGLTQGAPAFDDTALGEAESTLEAEIRAAEDAAGALVPLFPKGIEATSLVEAPLPTLAARCGDWAGSAGRLREWLAYYRARTRCEALDLGEFLAECRRLGVLAARLSPGLEHALLRQWLKEVYEHAPALREFDASTHERLVEKFRVLDARLHQAAVQDVDRAVRARIPKPLPLLEQQRLSQEAARKTRHRPLRRLLPSISTVLLAHKPCLMMSPLSVAIYLPKNMFRFDLVVFDEASQLPPGDAIGAVLRGRQVVILGDNKQLPPTDFFRAYADDDEETDEDTPDDVATFESILDIAIGTRLLEHRLLWHYRSVDERLIAFSNQWFYQRTLITFPASHLESDDTGVCFVHVPDGVWARGAARTNSREAQRIADLIIEHLEKCVSTGCDVSLGVITMNLAQRDLIERELQRRLQSRSDLAPLAAEDREEPLFIKNLETVQGDERNEIIIGIGYGPSALGGAPTLQFGPLNRAGGERRWNVAITRARRRTTLVASMLPHQLDGVRQSTREGPKAMVEYMTYAANGGQFETTGQSTREPDSDFEMAVRDALVRQGYKVDCQVGSSGFRIDLAVRHPDHPSRFILGVECDGRMYHIAKTARDRDRLRQDILEDRRWAIHRVWSTDWTTNPQAALATIIDRIERLRQSGITGVYRDPGTHADNGSALDDLGPGRSPASSAQSTASTSPIADGPATTSDRNGAESPLVFPAFAAYVTYRTSRVAPPHSMSHEGRYRYTSHVTRLVSIEGPVHWDVVIDRLLELCGRERRGPAITRFFETCINRAVVEAQIIQCGHFLYASGAMGAAARRAVGSVERRPEQIAPEEWDAAVQVVLERLGASEPNIIPRAVAAGFGYERVTSTIRSCVDEAVARLLDRYRIRKTDGFLYLAPMA